MTSRHTDMTDIRAWLRENRPELGVLPKGAIKDSALAVYRDAHGITPPERAPESAPAQADERAAAQADARPGAQPESRETPPERVGEAARGWLFRKGEPKPKPRRTPIDKIMSLAWSAAAQAMASSDRLLPVARCLSLQAPAAGMVLEEALRGSLLDKILQPVARTGKRGESVWAVVGPPILVAAVSSRPELYPPLRPMLREAVKSWVLAAAPQMRKAAAREAKLMEELDGDLTSIDELIDSLFAPPPGYQEGPPGAASHHAAGAAA